jgi:hypothetical protein
MLEPFQLPSVNALVGDDKHTLRMMMTMLVKEINDLRSEITQLKNEGRRKAGY